MSTEEVKKEYRYVKLSLSGSGLTAEKVGKIILGTERIMCRLGESDSETLNCLEDTQNALEKGLFEGKIFGELLAKNDEWEKKEAKKGLQKLRKY